MSLIRVKFGDFLKRSKIPITIKENEQYKRVTIKTKHQGVLLRDVEFGRKIGTKKQFILKKGQFVLSKIDARYGAFGIAPDEVDGAIITGNFWAYDVDTSMISIDWINTYTNSAQFYEVCERASSGITNRKYLDEKKFLGYEIPIPANVEEQKKILDDIDRRKSKFQALNNEYLLQFNLIRQLREQILQDAIKGKLVPQEYSDESAELLITKIKSEKNRLLGNKISKTNGDVGSSLKKGNNAFSLPKAWAWCHLEDLCIKIGSGSTPKGGNYSDSGYPFFRSQNILNDGLNYQDIKFISPKVHEAMRGTKVLPLDILLNITGGSLGRSCVVPNDFEEGNVSQHVCIIRPIIINVEFLNFVIRSPYFQKLIFSSTTGAGRVGLPKYNLEQFSIPVPPLNEQTRIVKKIQTLDLLCKELNLNLEQDVLQSEKLISSILNKYFRVDQLPISKAAEEQRKDKKAVANNRLFETLNMTIIEILKASNEPLQAASVWKASEFYSDIEQFYAELKKLVDVEKVVIEEKIGQNSYLRLAK